MPFMITSSADPKFGERIVILVETMDNSVSPNSNWLDKVKKGIANLPIYWRPKSIISVNHLPLTETGKPDRATAKQLAATNKEYKLQ